MKMLVGLIHADSGEFKILEKKPDEKISIMSQVGCMIEEPTFYPYLTAYENLKILLRFYPKLSQNRIDEVVACHAKRKKVTSKIQKNLLRVKKKPLDEKSRG